MDGTLAVWKQATCFEDLLQPGYFRDLPPYQTVLDAVKILCNTKPELDMYALSAYIPENPYSQCRVIGTVSRIIQFSPQLCRLQQR
jgi:hypothetical protein